MRGRTHKVAAPFDVVKMFPTRNKQQHQVEIFFGGEMNAPFTVDRGAHFQVRDCLEKPFWILSGKGQCFGTNVNVHLRPSKLCLFGWKIIPHGPLPLYPT